MGVYRLWTYICERRSAFFERVDLVEIAKSRPKGIRILVDFYSWEHFMKFQFFKTLSSQVGHPYLIFDGGEYELIDHFVKSFIQSLRNVHIELVFFLDGAKGSSSYATEQKWDTWNNRHKEEIIKLHNVMDFFRGKAPLSTIDMDHMTRPCLQEIQNLLTLQSMGCQLNQCVAGEADSFIARQMFEDEDAVAIFSNDSDFCIFPKSTLLHKDLFDLENDLALGSHSLDVRTPVKLICDIVSSEQVWKHFELAGPESLIELSILRGNDFTCPILKDVMWPKARFYSIKIEKVVQMLKDYEFAEKCPFFGRIIADNPYMQEAVQHSRKFYRMELGEEIDVTGSGCKTFAIILSNVRKCIYPSSVIAMWKSFYWHRSIMEEHCQELIPAEEALMPLRAYVYGILLPEDRHLVKEYGQSSKRKFDEILVYKVKDSAVPTLPVINENPLHVNLDIFEHILSHQERFHLRGQNVGLTRVGLMAAVDYFISGRSYFKQHGVKDGMIYILLRYFLLLNWEKNLNINPREFQVLCVWVMEKHDNTEFEFRKMKIVPSPRCITIENWFLLLFRLSYAFLGNILNLSHVFPTPAELFSGSVWVSLYTSAAVTDHNPAWVEPRPLSVPMEVLEGMSDYAFSKVSKHKNIIAKLAENVFTLKCGR